MDGLNAKFQRWEALEQRIESEPRKDQDYGEWIVGNTSEQDRSMQNLWETGDV